MAVQTFRHVAMLFPPGHGLLDRLLAMSAMLYDIALEERIHVWHKSGRSISPYDPFGSQTTVRKQDPGWEGNTVLEVRYAQARLDRAMLAFFSRVKSGREPGLPRLRARGRYRSFRVDDPKASGSEGHRGDFRIKGLPRMRFAVIAAAEPASGFPRRSQGAAGRDSSPVRTGSAGNPDGRAEARFGSGCGYPGLCHPCRRGTCGAPAEARGAKRDPPEAAIRRTPRAVSRIGRGLKSRGKKKATPASAHEKQAESVRQEHHRPPDQLAKCCDFFAVEVQEIRKGTSKRGLNRAIAAQGWREFFDIRNCRAASAGTSFVEVPRPARRRTARAAENAFRRCSWRGSTGAACAALNWTATTTRPETC